MDNNNVFLWIKATIVAAAGAFGAAFGWLGWLALAWVGCMALDYLTGSAAAAAKGSWSSAAARAVSSTVRAARTSCTYPAYHSSPWACWSIAS